jgi:hypothetical protein
MNGDSEQKGDHPESRPQPENKLQSIRDITEAIKDGDEKHVERLNVLADLLSDLNTTVERMVDLLT